MINIPGGHQVEGYHPIPKIILLECSSRLMHREIACYIKPSASIVWQQKRNNSQYFWLRPRNGEWGGGWDARGSTVQEYGC